MRIEPCKMVAPSWLPFVCLGLYCFPVVVVFVALFTGVWQFLLAVPTSILFMVLVNDLFSWYNYAEIKSTGNKIIYEVDSIVSILGNSKSRYEIKKITGLEFKGTKVIVTGDCYVKEPYIKLKAIDKVVIEDTTTEVNNLLKNFSEHI